MFLAGAAAVQPHGIPEQIDRMNMDMSWPNNEQALKYATHLQWIHINYPDKRSFVALSRTAHFNMKTT